MHNRTIIAQSRRLSTLSNPDSKLELLSRILTNKFDTAPYLNIIHDYKLRNFMARFRLSAHNLPIESMRYLNTPRNTRLYPFCCSAVDDELHFVMVCQNPDITLSRTSLFTQVSLSDTQFSIEGMTEILRNSDPTIIHAVAKHIKTIEATLKT